MKKVVQFGAGNIGRGFMGQLFYQSGYEIVFSDVAQTIVNELNKRNSYPIKVVTNDYTEEIIIKNVRAVDGTDFEIVAAEISDADLVATAVGVNVLPKIVKPLVMGLRKRWENGNYQPLNLIICENMLDANRFLEGMIETQLTKEENQKRKKTFGIVEASIGRMVPVMTEDMREGDALILWVEPYAELPVDRDGFVGEIPQIKGLIPYSPFEFYIQRKLFVHNAGHAILSYLGWQKGYTFIWETVQDESLKKICKNALLESAKALSKEHGVSLDSLNEYIDDLIFRFGNRALGDTILRVGGDPKRKLSNNDRLVGAAKFAFNHGIVPYNLALGIAAGFMFDAKTDPTALEVRSAVKKQGIEAAVQIISGIDEQSDLGKMVISIYQLLNDGIKPEKVLNYLN